MLDTMMNVGMVAFLISLGILVLELIGWILDTIACAAEDEEYGKLYSWLFT